MKWVEEPAQSLADGIEAAQHATTLDPQDPHPYAVLATLNVFNREPERGVESGERAVELNPSYALGHLAMGYALLFAGRAGEAIEAMNIALRLSPRDPTNTHAWSQIALAHLVNRDCEAAVDCARKAVRENAENFRAYHRLASALGHLGDAEGARKALEHSRRQMPDPDLAYFEATYAFKDRDMLTYFLDGIRKAGWVG